MTKRQEGAIRAFAHVRTSSATNVWVDETVRPAGGAAVHAFTARFDFAIIAEFNDPAVSGADPIETRPGFSALLDHIEAEGVRIVLVEDASRFAHQLVVQEAGVVALIERDVRMNFKLMMAER